MYTAYRGQERNNMAVNPLLTDNEELLKRAGAVIRQALRMGEDDLAAEVAILFKPVYDEVQDLFMIEEFANGHI